MALWRRPNLVLGGPITLNASGRTIAKKKQMGMSTSPQGIKITPTGTDRAQKVIIASPRVSPWPDALHTSLHPRRCQITPKTANTIPLTLSVYRAAGALEN